MAIHAITGVMGSGKSYEAVSEKIVPALRDEEGRRVITNIEGLNYQAIADFIGKPLDYVQAHLVQVAYERPSEPAFWYDPQPDGSGTATAVQPGDLVVLDEVWRYFNQGMKLPDDAMRFFRMHRHYVSPTNNLTCDVVLINQAMRGIHRDIRDIIEVQFNCRKLKVLGRPQNYQVSVLEGNERKPSHQFLRKYSSKVFPLYSSYTNANAKEAVDKRQSALNSPFFKVIIPMALAGILLGGYYTYHHFRSMGQPKEAAKASSGAHAASGPAGAPTTDPLAPVPPAAASPGQPAPQAPTGDWRVVAMYKVGGLPVALMLDDKGRYRTVTSGNYSAGASNDVTVAIPDAPPKDRATPWTGGEPTYTGVRGPSPSAGGSTK